MLRAVTCLALAGCAATLMACTTVLDSASLWSPGDRRDGVNGMSYTLGKAILLVEVRVFEETARLSVCVSEEIQTMDPEHQYVMTFRNSPFSADKLSIKTHPGTNILRQIDVKAIDQTDQFIINLAESAGAIVGAGKESAVDEADCLNKAAVELASVHMDPGDRDDVRRKQAAINDAVIRYASMQARRCTDGHNPLSQRLPRDACEEYVRISREFGRGRPAINLKWQRPEIPVGLPQPDCSVGFCYRPRLTHILTVDVVGSQSDSAPFSLTNSSPLLAMDISRGIAITKTTRITFDLMGQPASIYLQKGNDDGADGAEAVELAKLPATVITSYFGAVAKTVGYVNKSVTSHKKLIETQGKLRQAKLEAQLRGTESAVDFQTRKSPAFAMQVSNAVARGAPGAEGGGIKVSGSDPKVTGTTTPTTPTTVVNQVPVVGSPGTGTPAVTAPGTSGGQWTGTVTLPNNTKK